MSIRVLSETEKPSLLGSLFSFNDNDLATIKKYLVGGASLGAGVGLITSYANYLNRLKKRENEDDDDTLYVYKKASAESDSYLATPLAIAGGTVSTLATYALVKKLYTKMRLKAAQEDLDRAQHAFLDASGYETTTKKPKNKPTAEEAPVKVASTIKGRSLTGTEAILSTPVLVPLLSAIGAGIVTTKVLDKQFPSQVKKVKGPRRIEVIEKPEDDQEEYEKQASAEDMEVDGIEHLIRTVLLTKNATSDLSNLVAATAVGGLDDFEKLASVVGFVDALNSVKGASNLDTDPLCEHVAICTLAKKASIREQVAMLAAAEFAEMQSSAYKQAAALDDYSADCLYKAACCFGRATRYELSYELGLRPDAETEMSKKASTLDGLTDFATGTMMSRALKLQAIKQLVGSDEKDPSSSEATETPEEAEDKVEAGDFSDSTDTSGQEAGIHDADSPSRRKKKDKVKFISNTKSRRGFLSKIDSDVIDQILAP
jgi:hypothetical protein